MLTRILSDVAAASAIIEEWDDVAAAARRPLSSARWLLSWWRHAAPPSARLRVVTVRDDDGRLVGLAPCFLVRDRTGLIRCRFLGAGTSLRGDIVARPGLEEEVTQHVAAALAADRPRLAFIELEGVDPASIRRLAAAWPGRGASMVDRDAVPAPYTDCSDPYDRWFAARSSNVRSQIRRKRRVFDDAGAVFRFSGTEDVVRDVKAFIRLHHARWSGRGGSGVLTPDVEAMLLESGSEMVASGCLLVWCLDVEGEPVSVELFLSAGGTISYWLGGFDEAWGKHGPAIVALFALVERVGGRGSCRLDLGGGDQDYKGKLATGEECLRWAAIVPRTATWGPALVRFAPAVARRQLGSRISPERKAELKKLLSRLSR